MDKDHFSGCRLLYLHFKFLEATLWKAASPSSDKHFLSGISIGRLISVLGNDTAFNSMTVSLKLDYKGKYSTHLACI